MVQITPMLIDVGKVAIIKILGWMNGGHGSDLFVLTRILFIENFKCDLMWALMRAR